MSDLETPSGSISEDAGSVSTESGMVTVHRRFTDGGRLITEESEENLIQIPRLSNAVPVGRVGIGVSMTINLGNYESAKISIDCSVPALPEEVAGAFKFCKDFADEKLNEQVAIIREYKAKKKGE